MEAAITSSVTPSAVVISSKTSWSRWKVRTRAWLTIRATGGRPFWSTIKRERRSSPRGTLWILTRISNPHLRPYTSRHPCRGPRSRVNSRYSRNSRTEHLHNSSSTWSARISPMGSSCKGIPLQALCGTKEERTWHTTTSAGVWTGRDRRRAEAREWGRLATAGGPWPAATSDAPWAGRSTRSTTRASPCRRCSFNSRWEILTSGVRAGGSTSNPNSKGSLTPQHW